MSSYPSAAAAVMNAEAPTADDIVVPSRMSNGPMQASDYTNDTAPYLGGDRIQTGIVPPGNAYCTSNFSFTGKVNPNNQWIVTAGHCSNWTTGFSFYTCATKDSNGDCNSKFGSVSTAYAGNNDFETIGASNLGAIWDDQGHGGVGDWAINGQITPTQGDLVSTDGATDGSVFHLAVETSGGPNTCFMESSSHTICWAVILDAGSSIQICPGGDSGGPIFQRENTSGLADAAGIIQVHGNNSGVFTCGGQIISHVESVANLVLKKLA
jgi:hypothetical protein